MRAHTPTTCTCTTCTLLYVNCVHELESTNTYVRDIRECEQVVAEHLQFMVTNGIDVQDEHKASFYILAPKVA